MPVLRRRGRHRALDIAAQHALDLGPVPGAELVPSVNDPRTVALLREWAPAVVAVHGTRIIARPVLDAIDVPVLNVHAGITPRYRGVHGGYWALRDGRPDLAGSTVHLVDAGIDTGGVVAQAVIEPGARDTIATYPLLHLACALPLLCAQVTSLVDGTEPQVVSPLPGAERSQLRWHPTAWDYLRARARQGVR
jgi:folate-dependent phosphoribosylglycinamide formyltransferase PurN